MSDPFVRTKVDKGHRYRQLVQWYRDPASGKRRLRIIENLGPLSPIYRRPFAPRALPLQPVHLATLATALMLGTLSVAQVLSLVHDMAPEMPPPPALEAVGIRFDLGKKTAHLLLWPEVSSPAPSAPSPRALPAA
ncbi:MAG: hypothetical protein KGI89_16615, partial [Euryarchaeota archaeon]|nr:hypothetical protein [Euryarchaeota archaeon]